jgi:signal transduction histidine kinase
VTKTLQGVREISHNLRPYQLDRLGLSDTLRSVLETVRSSTTIRIKAQIDDIDSLLAPEAEINVFRIIQEGMNNILKHSKAKDAEITVARIGGRLAIQLKDNGRGFSPASNSEMRSFGLTGINQRVSLLGGTCSIESLPGHGTTINISIPLQNAKTK